MTLRSRLAVGLVTIAIILVGPLVYAIQSLRDLKEDDHLFETGIVNSLFAVQLMTFIEKTFAIEIGSDDLDIENFKSIKSTSEFVLKKNGRIAA